MPTLPLWLDGATFARVGNCRSLSSDLPRRYATDDRGVQEWQVATVSLLEKGRGESKSRRAIHQTGTDPGRGVRRGQVSVGPRRKSMGAAWHRVFDECREPRSFRNRGAAPDCR